MTPKSFADRFVLASRRLGHPLCVGLDPHLDRIPDLFRRGSMASTEPETAQAIEEFLGAILDRIAGRVAVVKPQIAFFEALGWRGLQVLERLVQKARRLGLLVLLDAKRGDIGSTAKAYAEAYLGEAAPLPCDAITLNAYLGRDTLQPFVDRAKSQGCGLFVLVKTSNPGSGDYQDCPLSEGQKVFEALAGSLDETADALRGETGWSSLGVVVGATYPGESEAVRELLPRALFLVPGYGAQGGSAAAAVRGFVAGPGGRLEGGLINSSRGILFPSEGHRADVKGWQAAIDGAFERSIDELSTAVVG